MPINEDHRIGRLQAAVDAINQDGGDAAAADVELILFMFQALRTARQDVNDLQNGAATGHQTLKGLAARVAALEARMPPSTLAPGKVPSVAAVRGANTTTD